MMAILSRSGGDINRIITLDLIVCFSPLSRTPSHSHPLITHPTSHRYPVEARELACRHLLRLNLSQLACSFKQRGGLVKEHAVALNRAARSLYEITSSNNSSNSKARVAAIMLNGGAVLLLSLLGHAWEVLDSELRREAQLVRTRLLFLKKYIRSPFYIYTCILVSHQRHLFFAFLAHRSSQRSQL